MVQRIDQGTQRGAKIAINVDGQRIVAYAGESVAAAMLAAGIQKFRISPRNSDPRGPFCLMGSCQECLVRINGKRHLACQERVVEGLSVETVFNDER